MADPVSGESLREDESCRLDHQMSPEFVSIGFCSNDHLCRVREIPVDGKTEMLEHLVQGGGPAGDAAVAAARLGWRAAFVATMGDDSDGRKMVDDFRSEGVCVDGIKVLPNQGSPVAYCWITPDGARSVAWTKSGLPPLDPADVPVDLVKRARILHLDGHQTPAALAAARIAKENGVLISLDAGTQVPGIDALLALADIVVASEAFARNWSGEDHLERALEKLEKCGNQVTGVTMGVAGSMCLHNGKFIRVPSVDAGPVVDTTGAGDSYHAAFAIRYSETGDVRGSMAFAAVYAAMKCRKLGARAGLPTRAEAEAFIIKEQP